MNIFNSRGAYLPIVAGLDPESVLAILDPVFENELKENFGMISALVKKTYEQKIELSTYFEALESTHGPSDISQNIRVYTPENDIWPTEDDYRSYLEDKCVLVTERFFYPAHTTNIGSTRHLLIKGFQLKGVGRAILSRLDYFHNWGGMKFQEAINEMVYGLFYHYSTPLGASRIAAVWIKKTKGNLNSTLSACAARESKTIRLAQVMHVELSPRDHLRLRSFITQKNSISVKVAFDRLIDQLSFCFYHNIFHVSDIAENLTLDGKFIDTCGVKFAGDLNDWKMGITLKYTDVSDSYEVMDTAYTHYLEIMRLSWSLYEKHFPEETYKSLPEVVDYFWERIQKICDENNDSVDCGKVRQIAIDLSQYKGGLVTLVNLQEITGLLDIDLKVLSTSKEGVNKHSDFFFFNMAQRRCDKDYLKRDYLPMHVISGKIAKLLEGTFAHVPNEDKAKELFKTIDSIVRQKSIQR